MSSPDQNRRQKTPTWVTVVIIVCMLPVVAFPSLLSLAPAFGEARGFVWFYPAYVIASGICAFLCASRRRDMMWILLALMLLTHAAMWALVLN